MNTTLTKSLSIQVRLSGLSFCVFNTANTSVEYLVYHDFQKKLTPFEVLDRLKHIIENEPVFTQNFKSVQVIHQNDLATLVPKPLFDEAHIADYLKFNSKILKSDFIAFDEIQNNDSVNVYVPYVNINNYIFDNFGAFEYKHASTILIEAVLSKETASTNTCLYVNVDKQHFEIIAVKKGNLLLYNSFEHTTKEDFIYFILFTVEQLQLDTETLLLKLTGNIEQDDELYKIAYKYIRFVEFDTVSESLTILPGINRENLHKHQLILYSCN